MSRAKPQGVNDEINSPDHYTAGGIECIEIIAVIAKNYGNPFEGYLIGSALKYIYRAPHKGQYLKDLKKARWFLDRLIDNIDP